MKKLITQADLDAAEADALRAITVIRAFREDRTDYRQAQRAGKALGGFVRLRERMVAQKRRALRLPKVGTV